MVFPTFENNITYEREKVISTDADLSGTPSFDFILKQFVLNNGSPKLINDIEAIRQWIVLFITTPRGVYPIYQGTGFGTSVRKLFGSKYLSDGFAVAELEREIKEGLPLCPAIKQVRDVNISKVARIIKIEVEVELYDGTLVKETVDNVYTIR